VRTSCILHLLGSQASVQVTFAVHELACMDPTVCDPLQKTLIEQHFGEQVSNAPPELLIHLTQRFKSLGNTAARRKQFQGQRLSLHKICLQAIIQKPAASLSAEAVKCYSQAIAAAERDATLYANRSAAYLALYQYQAALQDAAKAVQLHQSWPKAYYRFEFKLTCKMLHVGLAASK